MVHLSPREMQQGEAFYYNSMQGDEQALEMQQGSAGQQQLG